MAIPKEHLPRHGRAEGQVLRFPKRPLSLPRRLAVAALGFATALTGSEIANATNFTGLVEPIGGVPAFDQPLIGGGSRDLNPNTSQATVPLPGGGRTPTTEAPQRSELDRQIGAVSQQIESSHAIPQGEFRLWAEQNPISQNFGGFGLDNDMPVLDDNTLVRDDPARSGPVLLHYLTPEDRAAINDSNAVVDDFSPRLGPVYFEGQFNAANFPGEVPPDDYFLLDTLLRYDGQVTVPLTTKDGASAVISFGTIFWKDGKKTTMAFTSLMTDPSDPRLSSGEASFMGSSPLLGNATGSDLNTYNRITGITDNREVVSPSDLLQQLGDSVGSALELDMRGNGIAEHIRNVGYGDSTLQSTTPLNGDQFGVLAALTRGSVFNQPDVFALGEAAGQDLGFVIDSSDVRGSVQALVERVSASNGLDDVLTIAPFGQPYIVEGLQPIAP